MKKSLLIFFLFIQQALTANAAPFSSLNNWTSVPVSTHQNTAHKQIDAQNKLDYYDIGQSYLKNPPNYPEAIDWLKKSADMNYAPAQRVLGLMYLLGRGVTKDYKTSTEFLQKAADQGDNMAIKMLAIMYLSGQEIPKNLTAAAYYLEKIVPLATKEEPYTEEQRYLGLMYLKGYGVKQDKNKGISLLKKAAANGDKLSIIVLRFQ